MSPEPLEDWITEDNPVRTVDAFVDELGLTELGFAGAQPASTGRPAYHPATLLKIYIYGYLNRIQSSRRREREAQRNVELSRQVGLFTESVVAIDGSKFKAVNNRDKNFTPHKLQARMRQFEESIARYLDDLDRADREPASVPAARVSQLKEKIVAVKAQVRKLRRIERQMLQSPDQQVSLTDPDARSMATSGRGTGIVGYNVQTAVDTQHHMIVVHEVTNVGHDRTQLTHMATAARDAIGHQAMTA